MAEITIPRTGAHLRKLFEILLSYPDGLQAGEALKKLAASVQMTPYEAGLYESSGKPRFEKIIRFATIDVGKAGWFSRTKASGPSQKQERRQSVLDKAEASDRPPSPQPPNDPPNSPKVPARLPTPSELDSFGPGLELLEKLAAERAKEPS
jgi:hypothetical protein